ncbi:hypothetical protein HZC09_06440 [Candidatus Micrarchaeota archaeon]|nr:hypothetical protein [Candidatus Micrarchaeota archaeon]
MEWLRRLAGRAGSLFRRDKAGIAYATDGEIMKLTRDMTATLERKIAMGLIANNENICTF